MKVFLIDVFFRFFQAGVKQAFQLFLLIYGVYSLGLDKFGEYLYISTAVLSLSIFLDFGLSSTIVKLIAEDDLNKKKVLFTLSPYFTAFLLLLSLLIFLLSYYTGSLNFVNSLLVAGIIVLMPLCALCDGYNRGALNFKKNASSTFIASLVSLPLVIPFVDYFLITGLLCLQLIYHLVLFLFLAKACLEKTDIKRFKPIKNNKFLIDVIKYSALIGIASVGQILFTKADVIILGYYDYYREISQYEIIDRFFMYAVIPIALIGQVVAPRVVNNDATKIVKYHSLSMFLIFSLSILISVVIFISFSGIESLLSDKVNMDGFGLVLFILLLSLPFKMFAVFQTQGYINPLGHASIIAKTTIIFGVVNVILDFLLIGEYGFVGVFYSTAFVVICNTVTQVIIFRRKVKNAKCSRL